MTQQVLPTLRKQRSGTIVDVSAINGKIALPGLSAYVATKFAMEVFSESSSYELTPFGIKVNLVEPGAVGTRAWDNRVKAQGALSKDSPHSEMVRTFDSSVSSVFENGSTPDQIAIVILEAISSKEAKLRHTAGQDAPVFLRRKELTNEQFADYMNNFQPLGTDEAYNNGRDLR